MESGYVELTMDDPISSDLHCPLFFFKLENGIVLIIKLVLKVDQENIRAIRKGFLNSQEPGHDNPLPSKHIAKNFLIPALDFAGKNKNGIKQIGFLSTPSFSDYHRGNHYG